MIILAGSIAWFSFEVFKVLPNVSEYQVVVYKQQLELIEKLNIEQILHNFSSE